MKKKSGKGGMVDVSNKSVTKRTAVATASICMSERAFKHLLSDGSPKGDVLETAKVAGIMAAKNTPQILPLCHPLALTKAEVSFSLDQKKCSVTARAEIICAGKTGVEMEALTAVSVAVLTVYDMMKWAGQGMTISDVKLLKKTGGKSGDYRLG